MHPILMAEKDTCILPFPISPSMKMALSEIVAAQDARSCLKLVAHCLQDRSRGEASLELNPDDVEQSLLRQRLYGKFGFGEIPDLVTLTKVTQHIIREDLERMIQLTVDNNKTDYAIFTGVQIHGLTHKDWIWIETSYVFVDGERNPLL